MRRILAVAEYIFKQSFRNKMLNILVIFAVFAIGFSLAISALAQESEMKMVQDFGLFAISLFAFLTLVLSITIQMFEETELKTISMIMVKPIKRHEYITGKYLGITATIFMNVLLMLIVLMIIIAIKGGDPWDLRLIVSAFYSFLGVSMIAATALLLSVITTSVPTCVIYLVFLYALGHLTIHLKNLVKASADVLVKNAVDAVYYIVPNMELFNLKDKISSPEGIFNISYMGFVLGYAVLYTALTLIAASLIFDKKEF